MKPKVFEVTGLSFQILKSNPPKLAIIANGSTRTGGWSNPELRPLFEPGVIPKGGIYEFEFVATPPQGIAIQVISPINAVYYFEEMPQQINVVVYAETNKKEMSDSKKSSEFVAALTNKTNGGGEGLRRAKGYSEKLDFNEAFLNAVQNLPPDPNPFPDKLTNVTVTRVGAEFGGFVGFHRMVVEVEAN
jgi:hypothetical protein